ncbi:MAG: preprotein translocase subunit YajC [Rhodothermales bacterium]|nr:preprotein translocase subunit YajC [Rhodothermales bacterium]
MFSLLLLAAPQAQEAPSLFVTLLPLLLIFVVFYLFIIRPQKKREDKRKAMIEAVKKNDKIVTAGGLHGTVTQVDDTSVLVQVDTNVKLRVDKNAIASVAGKEPQ